MIKLVLVHFLFNIILLNIYAQKSVDNLCESNQHVTENITTGWYKASTILTSDGTIDEASTVIFSAEDRVQLVENFTVPNTSNFTAANYVCNEIVADVIEVTYSGNSNSYTFSVTIQSPDTGCNQYANWWEVVSLDGQLLYRRILGHSHVAEQPFTRSGGPVNIEPDQEIFIRAWMHPTGYGGSIFKGSVANGFNCAAIAPGFAEQLSTQPPLPTSCPN